MDTRAFFPDGLQTQPAPPGKSVQLHPMFPCYLLEGLTALGFTAKYTGEFFHEFVTICPCDAAVLTEKLAARGYLSGLVTGQSEMLWCTTEMNTKSEIDGLIAVIKEVLA